ncbi:ABC multidrug transporter C [Drechslerella dactyloides]|uniref:ABC multidrug transporter C n=1 Tax=Drechslerella dactyloides TaxID=74499 RepID=A0AAD6IY66_DREDA|nr:ABC multidrug transporter C [Drechslerella dactyloides]
MSKSIDEGSATQVESGLESFDGSRNQSRNEDNNAQFGPGDEERVIELARRLSRTTSHAGGHHLTKQETRYSTFEGENPFVGSDHPQLQPGHERFNPKAWLKSIVNITARDPERYPSLRLGVSFKNLSAHGYGSATDYQKNVGNIGYSYLERFLTFGKKRKIQILRDFEGVIKSSEMCVVLGRPGSGCSTFLKTIAGDTYGFYLSDDTVLNYQGIPMNKMHKAFRGEVIYQAETDVHFPQLTVGQTLKFAALARTPRNRFGDISRDQFAEHMKDVVMAAFGLSHTVDTNVGNDFIRGVSGGERKRVSIAEVAVSGAPIQCWDNSTRGLDSANALEFIRTLRLSAELTGSTAFVAIYQASQSAYDQFHKVIVLYEGRQIYFGPTGEARQFFEDMGFECEERATTADFLTSLTNPAERRIKAGFEDRVPRTPDEFAQRWKESEPRKRLMDEIAAFEADNPLGKDNVEKFKQVRQTVQAKNMSSTSPYTISYPMQVRLCMGRGFQRLRGDLSLAFTSIFGNGIMALIVSSVYYNLQPNTGSFYSRGSLLFFAVLLNGFASALEILTLYAQRPIIEKHDKYALYRPSAEAVSSMIVDLPQKILSTIVFNLILYFMTHLRREPGAFFIFLLFSFSTTMAMSMIFRTIASVSRTLHQALTPAAIFILGLVMYTGFAIPVVEMRGWARWIGYINPISYSFESLMVNEFSGRDFVCSNYVPNGPGYENISGDSRVCSATSAVAGQEVVSGDQYINISFQYFRSHMWRNLGIVWAYVIVFCAVYLIATDRITAAKSKGEVLVFKQGKEPAKAKKGGDDIEDAAPQEAAREQELGAVMTREISVAAIQKQTSIFHWKNVVYDIPVKGGERRLLDHICGWVKPGTLTALMGVSGAGKTTLLDVLASRKTTGVITGDMFVNGQKRDGSFQRKTGYVQQQDLHLETSTVREALEFSALLRQPQELSKEEKLAYVEEVIQILEMEEFIDAVVGVPGEGLNVEQRKRLTIGVELAARPELLLFLDEPTSGLDSQTAWSICTLLRKLARNGQAILCTIHQPSAILFQEFDRLLFLAAGGRQIYFGEIGDNSETLISYFERNGGFPCPADANPAEWMLEVIGAAPGSHSEIDWPRVWRESPENAEVLDELDRMEKELPHQIVEGPMSNLPSSKNDFAVPFSTQIYYVFIRVWQQYWRTPSYIYAKLILCVLSALFVGFSFYNAGTSLAGLQGQMFSIFLILTTFGQLVQQLMPHFVLQRSLYEARERPSRTYKWTAFMVSNLLVELPWQTLAAVLVFFSFYFPTGMYKNALVTHTEVERGGLFFLYCLSFYLFTSTFGTMVIAGVELSETGGNLANFMFSICLIFCGILVPPGGLPAIWRYTLNYISPFTYMVGGILATGLANTDVVCNPREIVRVRAPSGMDCGEYLTPYSRVAGIGIVNPNSTDMCEICSSASTNAFLSALGVDYSQRWRNWVIFSAYIIFNLFAAVAMYYLVRVPKDKDLQIAKTVDKNKKVQQVGVNIEPDEKP